MEVSVELSSKDSNGYEFLIKLGYVTVELTAYVGRDLEDEESLRKSLESKNIEHLDAMLPLYIWRPEGSPEDICIEQRLDGADAGSQWAMQLPEAKWHKVLDLMRALI